MRKHSFLEVQFIGWSYEKQNDEFDKVWEILPYELRYYLKDENLSFTDIHEKDRLSTYLKGESLSYWYIHFKEEAKRERTYHKPSPTISNDIRSAKTSINNALKYLAKLQTGIKQLDDCTLYISQL